MVSSSNHQGAISQCLLGYSFHIACFSSSLSRHGPLHPSRCSQQILTIVCTAPPTSARFKSCALPGTSCSGVWDPWSVEFQSCKLAMLLWYKSTDWLCSDICYTFFAGVSVCFVSWSPSQPIRQIICCRAVPLYLNLHWNSQIHVYGSQVWSNLTSFHHCAELRFSQRSGLSSSEEWIQILQCDCQSEGTNPFVLFLQTSVFGNSNAALGFQPDIALHVSAE